MRLIFEPNETFSGDVRVSFDNLDTRGFYFVIPRDVEANPFATFTTPPNANDVTSPIQVDQAGVDERDLFTGALRLNFELGGGTLTSVSAYNSTEEIITGDAYDFRPAATTVDLQCPAWLRPQPEPVPRSVVLEPGNPLHLE